MNYYEELGISPDAGEEDIRKAHRRLVKLMHPDAQRDQSLKMLAETQMRRLNSIVSTLLDPDQRRSYDDQLRGVYAVKPAPERAAGWRGMPWWIASAVGAVVLTLAAVWFWADHMGSTFGKTTRTVYVSPETTSPAPGSPKPSDTGDQATPGSQASASSTPPAEERSPTLPLPPPHEAPQNVPAQSEPPPTAPAHVRATIVPSDTHPDTFHPPMPEAPRVKVPAVVTTTVARVPIAKPPVASAPKPNPKPNAVLPPPVIVTTAKPTVTAPPGPLVASANPKPKPESGQFPPSSGNSSAPPVTVPGTMPTTAPPVAVTPPKAEIAPTPEPAVTTSVPSKSGAGISGRDPLEGEWVYAPKEPEKRKSGFYPPEFIKLQLFANDSGSLHGQYTARYEVTDKPISPDVAFQLAAVDKNSRKFVWQSSNGTKGTLAIHPVDDRTIRLEWHTTSSVQGPALTSGAATLVRR